MMKKAINAEKAPAAVGPYVHAVEACGLIFTSGQLGLIPESGLLPEGVEAQTHQSLKNLAVVLEAAGSDLDHVVKTSVFLQDINDFAKVNEIYAQYFQGETPARSCVQVAKLPKGGLVEIEVVAVKKD
ncbi:MAG: RidA family protein [Lachnospiraceae bacterium]|nr:RidA family protein [Lachnospiraceae bacterium]